MKLIKTIAANIKDRRNELMLTQKQVAENAGLKRQAICNIEVGENGMTISTLEKVSKALLITPVELLKERE